METTVMIIHLINLSFWMASTYVFTYIMKQSTWCYSIVSGKEPKISMLLTWACYFLCWWYGPGPIGNSHIFVLWLYRPGNTYLLFFRVLIMWLCISASHISSHNWTNYRRLSDRSYGKIRALVAAVDNRGTLMCAIWYLDIFLLSLRFEVRPWLYCCL